MAFNEVNACKIINKAYSFPIPMDPTYVGRIYNNFAGEFIFEPRQVVVACAEKDPLLVIAVNSKISNIIQRKAVFQSPALQLI